MKIDKPYIALNSETYILLCSEELSTGKRISYKYYCEKLFVVKSKTRYSCVSSIYFNLDADIIKENCNFDFNSITLASNHQFLMVDMKLS